MYLRHDTEKYEKKNVDSVITVKNGYMSRTRRLESSILIFGTIVMTYFSFINNLKCKSMCI